MKKQLRSFGVLLLVVAYSYSVATSYHFRVPPSTHAIHGTGDVTSAAGTLNPAIHVSSTTPGYGVAGAHQFKNVPSQLGAAIRVLQQQLATRFHQYDQLAHHFLILQRKANRMFPFHSFW